MKKRGRPTLPEGKGKRQTLALRVTEERRKALEEAADRSGRSLSQELEIRLERSFDEEAAYGGTEMAALFRTMAGAASVIRSRLGGKLWSRDAEAFIAVRAAWLRILDQAQPDYTPDPREQYPTDSLSAVCANLVEEMTSKLREQLRQKIALYASMPENKQSKLEEGTRPGDEN
jgi:hypothetical protein